MDWPDTSSQGNKPKPHSIQPRENSATFKERTPDTNTGVIPGLGMPTTYSTNSRQRIRANSGEYARTNAQQSFTRNMDKEAVALSRTNPVMFKDENLLKAKEGFNERDDRKHYTMNAQNNLGLDTQKGPNQRQDLSMGISENLKLENGENLETGDETIPKQGFDKLFTEKVAVPESIQEPFRLVLKQNHDLLRGAFELQNEQLGNKFQEIAESLPQAKELTSLKKSNSKLKSSAEAKKRVVADLNREKDEQKDQLLQLREDEDKAQREIQILSDKLEAAVEESEEQLQEFDLQMSQIKAHLNRKKAENTSLKANVALHEAEIKRYEAQGNDYKATGENYKAENERLKTKLHETQKELSKMERTHRNTGSDYEKTSDGDLQSAWLQLDCSIRNLAHLLSQNIPENGFIEEHETACRFAAISRMDHKKLLQDPAQAWLLLYAYLWRVARLFVLPHDNELTGIVERFEDVRLDLLTLASPDEASAMATWFSEKWQLIESKLGMSRKGVHIVAIEEARLLTCFIPNGPRKDEDVTGLEEHLRLIMCRARKLNATMGSSKAVFKREWWNTTEGPAVEFDHTAMEKANIDSSSSEVLFTISPQVIKYGNADGHHHCSQMTLVKAKVVLAP